MWIEKLCKVSKWTQNLKCCELFAQMTFSKKSAPIWWSAENCFDLQFSSFLFIVGVIFFFYLSLFSSSFRCLKFIHFRSLHGINDAKRVCSTCASNTKKTNWDSFSFKSLLYLDFFLCECVFLVDHFLSIFVIANNSDRCGIYIFI